MPVHLRPTAPLNPAIGAALGRGGATSPVRTSSAEEDPLFQPSEAALNLQQAKRRYASALEDVTRRFERAEQSGALAGAAAATSSSSSSSSGSGGGLLSQVVRDPLEDKIRRAQIHTYLETNKSGKH